MIIAKPGEWNEVKQGGRMLVRGPVEAREFC